MKTDWVKLKSKIPHQVKIRTKTYEVAWIDQFKDGKTLGETRFELRQIILLNNMSPKMTVSTFFHEYLHAICHEYNVNLTENQVLALEKSFININSLILELNS
jgi:hypothetical protein